MSSSDWSSDRVSQQRSNQAQSLSEWNNRKSLILLFFIVSAFVVYIVSIRIELLEVTQLLSWITITGIGGVLVYLFRLKLDDFDFRKTVWIVGGSCLFGMPLALGWVHLVNLIAPFFVIWLATTTIPLVLRVVILGIVLITPPLLGGGLIAEFLGKRRDYMPYV